MNARALRRSTAQLRIRQQAKALLVAAGYSGILPKRAVQRWITALGLRGA